MLTAVPLPRTSISVASCTPGSDPGRWLVCWLVVNEGDDVLRLEDAWVPHGRFRGEGHVPLDVLVSPSSSMRLELEVAVDEPPGTVVSNAFLVLRVLSGEDSWRIFARMRIEFGPGGAPVPIVENVTVQSMV